VARPRIAIFFYLEACENALNRQIKRGIEVSFHVASH